MLGSIRSLSRGTLKIGCVQRALFTVEPESWVKQRLPEGMWAQTECSSVLATAVQTLFWN